MTSTLRAENVSNEAMTKLAEANGRMVNYKGFYALVRLHSNLNNGTKQTKNCVDLEFNGGEAPLATSGDFSILSDLQFRMLAQPSDG
jgi:hypothetical protein